MKLPEDPSADATPPRGGPMAATVAPDEPMTDALCLYLLGLVADGRSVPPGLVARARAWAADHPDCARTLAEMQLAGRLLASEPPRRAAPDFAARVLAAAGASPARAGRPAELLVLSRRLAVAAALVLAVTLLFDATHPGQAAADPRIELQTHAVDAFRARPFGPDDLDAGLRALLADPVPLASAAGPGEPPRADEPTTGEAR